MSFGNDHLVNLNRDHSLSERDDFTLERYAQFAKHFPPHTEDVLDIGCNTGRGGQVINSRLPRARIVGLDCVPERLQRVDPNIYRATICGFADSIDMPTRSFDVIVAGEIIEHIPNILVFPTLCELFRLLRIRGRLLLTTPNPHYLRNRLQNKSVLSEEVHVSQHTVASIRRRLEEAGFSGIGIYGSGKVTRFIGEHFPIIAVYGSFLAVGEKW